MCCTVACVPKQFQKESNKKVIYHFLQQEEKNHHTCWSTKLAAVTVHKNKGLHRIMVRESLILYMLQSVQGDGGRAMLSNSSTGKKRKEKQQIEWSRIEKKLYITIVGAPSSIVLTQKTFNSIHLFKSIDCYKEVSREVVKWSTSKVTARCRAHYSKA